MNENINLCEILKGYKDEIFYSPLHGEVQLISTSGSYKYPIRIMELDEARTDSLTSNGHYSESNKGECMLFPSKDQRDWNKWIEEHKPKTPKTWSEFINSEYYEWDEVYSSLSMQTNPIYKSMFAFLKIYQLIEVGYSGNVSDEEWKDDKLQKWYFIPNKQYPADKGNDMWEIVYSMYYDKMRHIAFHTREQAEEFLSYPENVQLLRDYFMIKK